MTCIVVLGAALVVAVVVSGQLRRDHVQPDALAQLIDRADRLVVFQGPREGEPVLFESSKRQDLDALKSALRVERPEDYLHCMCDGTPAIFLYANGEKIGQITNHHAKLLRCSLWGSDAPLADPEAFLRWFDERGMPGPRSEYESDREQKKAFDRAKQKWLEAVPPALPPHWPAAASRLLDPDLSNLRRALAEGIPDRGEQILALFAWYGSGMGPWSGFPAYEDIPEKLLLDYPTRELLGAIDGKELTWAQTEGVARLFGGWGFFRDRPEDLALLPAELKSRLLRHSMASSDEDKRGRAEHAFGKE